MKTPAERLLGGHAFGTLSEDERRELYTAALEDQDLFDALAEEEPVRRLVADRTARRELLEALDRPSPGERLRRLLRRPATWADLAGATSVLAVALVAVRFFAPGPPETPRAASASPALLRALFERPAEPGTPGQLRIEGAHVVFRVERDAQAILAMQTADGAIACLFPSPGRSARVAAGQSTIVDPPRGAEARRLRLAVFPQEVDPRALDPAALHALGPRIRLLEWTPPSKGDLAP